MRFPGSRQSRQVSAGVLDGGHRTLTGLPPPCPPQPMTAMPSFSLGARAARMFGRPRTGIAPATAPLRRKKRRRFRMVLLVIAMFLWRKRPDADRVDVIPLNV